MIYKSLHIFKYKALLSKKGVLILNLQESKFLRWTRRQGDKDVFNQKQGFFAKEWFSEKLDFSVTTEPILVRFSLHVSLVIA
jgi:hypothetical protein